MRASVLSDWLAQRLDRGSGQPIYRQLHRLLQQAILSRELPAGTQGAVVAPAGAASWASGAIPSRRCTSSWRWKAM